MSIEVAATQTVRLKADIDRSIGFLRKWARFMFTPWKALTLSPVT